MAQQTDALVGKVITKKNIVGSINVAKKQNIHGNISSKNSIEGRVNVGGVIERLPDYYEGSYDIEPKNTELVLQTKEKTMKEDLTVKPVLLIEVTNPAGGTTVIIGGE